MSGGKRIFRQNLLEREFIVNKNFPGGFDDKMSTREAMLILNVKSATKHDIIKGRHKKLIIKNHPDKGTFILFYRKKVDRHIWPGRSTKLKMY